MFNLPRSSFAKSHSALALEYPVDMEATNDCFPFLGATEVLAYLSQRPEETDRFSDWVIRDAADNTDVLRDHWVYSLDHATGILRAEDMACRSDHVWFAAPTPDGFGWERDTTYEEDFPEGDGEYLYNPSKPDFNWSLEDDDFDVIDD